MKVLSIGNSFSHNAHIYLRDVARCAGDEWRCVNLYIGGCPLWRHHANLMSDARNYEIQFAGMLTGFRTSIREALLNDEWDIVTLQQVSHLSENLSSYIPYIDNLAEEVRRYAPNAKLMIHQTWAYEDGSERILKYNSETTHAMMFENIRNNYANIAERVNAYGIIPSGEAMYHAHKAGLKVYADGYHANSVGKYLLSLTWYQTLSGKSLTAEMLRGNGVAEDEVLEELLRCSAEAVATIQ